ncbi:MAG: beta-galactosidase [Lentisphaeria bacterium]|nr:beta-galactosidase [Lentisphaeria bacterium]
MIGATKSEITRKNGKVQFLINNKVYEPILYNYPYKWPMQKEAFRRELEMFRNADVHLYTVCFQLHEFVTWPDGSNKQCFAPDKKVALFEVDKRIKDALDADPNAYIMFAITAGYHTIWWEKAHPEECIAYPNTEVDYSCNYDGGNYITPSMASKVWRKDLCDVIAQVCEQIKKSPYGDRVFAIRIDFGSSREWFLNGFDYDLQPDVSKPMLEAFRAYLKEKYGTVENLRKNWSNDSVTFETAQIPSPRKRRKTSAGSLRHPIVEGDVLDYLETIQKEAFDLQIACNKVAKEAFDGRLLVGNYSGYFGGIHMGAEHRQTLNYERLMSDYVDFQIAPPMYNDEFRGMGAPSLSQATSDSHKLYGKMSILENDTRTHLEKGKFQKFANNQAESNALLMRDFGMTLAKDTGMWFLDFGRDFYDTNEFRKLFQEMTAIKKLPATGKSTARVAVVANYGNLLNMCIKRWDPMAYIAVSRLLLELSYSGVAWDCISIEDLKVARDYDVYFFPNSFYLNDNDRLLIEKLKQKGNKTFVWTFAPGWLSDKGDDLQGIEQVSSFKVKVIDKQIADRTIKLTANNKIIQHKLLKVGPFFAIENADKKIGTTDNCVSIGVRKDDTNTHYLTSVGLYPGEVVRQILADAKVHIYCDNPKDIIFANNDFLTHHTANGGETEIKLPTLKKVKMVYPKEQDFGETQLIKFTADPKSTTIFYLK